MYQTHAFVLNPPCDFIFFYFFFPNCIRELKYAEEMSLYLQY